MGTVRFARDDGLHLVFQSNRSDGHSQFWMVDTIGASLHLFIRSAPYDDVSPSWR
jgi:hypothetical protein